MLRIHIRDRQTDGRTNWRDRWS